MKPVNLNVVLLDAVGFKLKVTVTARTVPSIPSLKRRLASEY